MKEFAHKVSFSSHQLDSLATADIRRGMWVVYSYLEGHFVGKRDFMGKADNIRAMTNTVELSLRSTGRTGAFRLPQLAVMIQGRHIRYTCLSLTHLASEP